MFCWRARRWLSAYIDGELSPARKGMLETHLRSCADCTALEARLRSTWLSVPSLTDAADGVDLWPGILRGLVDGQGRNAPEQHGSRLLAPATVTACVVAGLAMGTLFAQQFARAGATRATVTQVSADDSFVEAFGDPPLESVTGAATATATATGTAAAGAQEDAQ
jgi:anti-sigma factor RsiW